jgi:hypothetical protein
MLINSPPETRSFASELSACSEFLMSAERTRGFVRGSLSQGRRRGPRTSAL